MEQTDLAWLAGIIDGEGYVGFVQIRHPKKIYYQVAISVRMTHEPTIDHVADLMREIGVTFTKQHCPATSERHKESKMIRMTGMADVKTLAEAVRPYAVTKAEQLDVVIEWCTSRLSKRFGAYTDEEMQIAARGLLMNTRGPQHSVASTST